MCRVRHYSLAAQIPVRQLNQSVDTMPILSLKALFPACATFGPVFMLIGILALNRQASYGSSLVVTGGLLTSAALHILFQMLNAQQKATSADHRSEK